MGGNGQSCFKGCLAGSENQFFFDVFDVIFACTDFTDDTGINAGIINAVFNFMDKMRCELIAVPFLCVFRDKRVFVKAGASHDMDVGCLTQTLETLCISSQDRKSTRLNSSHVSISYAVFCLKKKKVSITYILTLYDINLERRMYD